MSSQGVPLGGSPIAGLFFGGPSADGEPSVFLVLEQPEQLPGYIGQVEKAVLEHVHLARFQGDCALATGRLPFTRIEPGGDPPDYLVDFGGRNVRLDCAAFALQRWRTAYRLFQSFSERLHARTDGYDFSGLVGCEVMVYFGHESQLPPRRSDDSIIGPLLALLDGSSVDHDLAAAHAAGIVANGFPPTMPAGVVALGELPDGSAGFVANPVVTPGTDGIPSDLPYCIRLGLSEEFSASTVGRMMQRLVDSHDKPEIEHLLVTAGGPDRHGVRYPAEEMLAQFLLEQRPDFEAEYLQEITLHCWGLASIHAVPVTRRRVPEP